MAVEQTLLINFSQGLNTKTDPWQLPIGQFLSLQNSIFQTGGLLAKRNGYGFLTGSNPAANYLTTLNGNLIAIGSNINAYLPATMAWLNKGTIEPTSISVMPLIRNNVNQVYVDSATANGIVCLTYTQNYGSSSGSVTNYYYSVLNVTTGQSIVSQTSIPVLSNGTINGSSRVFIVGNYFVIVSPVLISGTTYLQYFSIPINNPTIASAAQNTYPEAYVPLTNAPGWDGAVDNNTLVLAYNTTTGGQGVHVIALSEALIAANSDTGVIHAYTSSVIKAGLMSVCVDTTTPAGQQRLFYFSFWNSSNNSTYTGAFYLSFGAIVNQFVPQPILTSTTLSNITSAALNGVCKVFMEVPNNYSYDSSIPSNFISYNTITSSGTAGSSARSVQSVGLASKAFLSSGTIYYLAAYQSSYQSTYFLIDGSNSIESSPYVIAKLAYQNGGGYLPYGIPSVTFYNGAAHIAYLYKQDVEALNTTNSTQASSTGGVYSQLGINLAEFTIETTNISSAEIAKDLHISGGYLGMFDGTSFVEQNFFLFPDNVEASWTASSAVTPTGTWSSGATVITVSSATGIYVGMTITDTSNSSYIPSGTTVVYVSGTSVTISQATTHSATGDNLSIQGNIAAQPDGSTNTNAYYYQVTYEWTDSQGNAHKSGPSIAVPVTTTGSGSAGTITIYVPTLRLTWKTANPVKIVIYRWSVHTQAYNQVTSINSPILNNFGTTAYITYLDTLPDAQVIGNNLIYTTGGVVPDTNGPASNIVTLFDTRLWQVDAEDPNLLWVSKTVVESSPVEMSSDFTIYVSPTIGAVSSTGPITALAPMDDKLIIFKQNAIYYINGVGPDNLGTTSIGSPLGSYSQPIFITSIVGCTNQQSIVLTSDGLMFQSNKGIWLLSRALQTSYIGAPVEAYNQNAVTSAFAIPETNYVLFSLNSGPMLMYDYFYGQWGTFNGVSATSSCIYNNLHTVLTQYGQIWQETPGVYLDGTNPVLMQFTTSWINLASLQGYERIYEFYLLAKYLSPHFLNVGVAYDYNPSIYHNSIISPQNFTPAQPSPFGVPTPFGSTGNLEQWRVHAKQQVCQSFQISISEVFDPEFATSPGAGFTLSGLNCLVGVERSLRPIRGANTIG